MRGCRGLRFIRCFVFILPYVTYFTCAFSNRLHHHLQSVTRTVSNCVQNPRPHSLTQSWASFLESASIVDSNETSRSAESTFWLSVPASPSLSNTDTSKLPAITGLDKESGPLPPGAYEQFGERDTVTSCLLGIGIQPEVTSDDGNEIWVEASRNCQKLIDSGFNTFIMNNPDADDLMTVSKGKYNKIRFDKPDNAIRTKIRHEAEEKFYKSLQQNTPNSILRACHFMVHLEVPSILSTEQQNFYGAGSDESAPVFGNGWMVRQSVVDALKRVKGETLGSVILEYCEHSPYHLDVLDSLSEMKREGLIQSISTKYFPPKLLRSALSCGFDIQSNSIYGNLLNTENLRSDSELGMFCSAEKISRNINAPLGCGLLTDKALHMSRNKIETLLRVRSNGKGKITSASQNWEKYQSIMNVLHQLSHKYQVSIETISLRWLLQLNEEAGDSIIVGSNLGMDLREQQGGKAYNRQHDLREVFTIALEHDDMELLSEISGQSCEEFQQDNEHKIDFNNRALWI